MLAAILSGNNSVFSIKKPSCINEFYKFTIIIIIIIVVVVVVVVGGGGGGGHVTQV